MVEVYRKILKISPGAYIFQRPFLRGLFLEGLIFRGAYLRRGICVLKSIGLAYSWKEIYRFALFYSLFGGNFQVQAPQGAFIRRGDVTEGFLRYEFGGLIFGGASTRRGLFSESYGIFQIHGKTRLENEMARAFTFGKCIWEASETMGCDLRRCNFSTLSSPFSCFGHTL